MSDTTDKLRECASLLSDLAGQTPDNGRGLQALSEALYLVAALQDKRQDKPKEHPAAIEVGWADKPRYPYRIAKCPWCEVPIASVNDDEMRSAGWHQVAGSDRWYCPECV
jgi:hypothetical protein